MIRGCAGALVAVLATGCELPSRESCAQVVGGTWRVTAPAELAGRDFVLVDHGNKIEGYALSNHAHAAVDDVELPVDMHAAPIALDLTRTNSPGGVNVAGTASRRFSLGGSNCVVSAPVSLTTCSGHNLTLSLPVLVPPGDLAACVPSAMPTSTVSITLRQLAESH